MFVAARILAVFVALAAALATAWPVKDCATLTKPNCGTTPGCAWCGNGTDEGGNPIGTCYDPSFENATCCVGPNAETPSCGSISFKVCHGHDTCSVDKVSTHYGDCYDTACCPSHLPVSCRGQCYPAGKVCCGTAVCREDQRCCKDGFQAGVCCDAKATSQCCGGSWNLYCCPSNTDCGYFWNASTQCTPAPATQRRV